jgi:hypothetical protein
LGGRERGEGAGEGWGVISELAGERAACEERGTMSKRIEGRFRMARSRSRETVVAEQSTKET